MERRKEDRREEEGRRQHWSDGVIHWTRGGHLEPSAQMEGFKRNTNMEARMFLCTSSATQSHVSTKAVHINHFL